MTVEQRILQASLLVGSDAMVDDLAVDAGSDYEAERKEKRNSSSKTKSKSKKKRKNEPDEKKPPIAHGVLSKKADTAITNLRSERVSNGLWDARLFADR